MFKIFGEEKCEHMIETMVKDNITPQNVSNKLEVFFNSEAKARRQASVNHPR
jgi:hypothetical protein